MYAYNIDIDVNKFHVCVCVFCSRANSISMCILVWIDAISAVASFQFGLNMCVFINFNCAHIAPVTVHFQIGHQYTGE